MPGALTPTIGIAIWRCRGKLSSAQADIKLSELLPVFQMWMTRRGREKIGKTHHKIRSDTFRPAGIDAFYILLFCASGSVGLHLTQLEMSRWVLQARLFIHYLSGRLLHLQLFVLCRSFSIAMFASEKMHRGLVSTCKSISIQVSLLTFTCNEIAACSSNVHWIYIYIYKYSALYIIALSQVWTWTRTFGRCPTKSPDPWAMCRMKRQLSQSSFKTWA